MFTHWHTAQRPPDAATTSTTIHAYKETSRHVQRASVQRRKTCCVDRVSGPTEEEPRFAADQPPPGRSVHAPLLRFLITAFRQRQASWRSFVVILRSSPMTTYHRDPILPKHRLSTVTFAYSHLDHPLCQPSRSNIQQRTFPPCRTNVRQQATTFSSNGNNSGTSHHVGSTEAWLRFPSWKKMQFPATD